jgi:hypothetical protein
MASQDQASDGSRIVSADELRGGRLYVLVERDDGESYLRHLPRHDDELPRIRITEEALQALREFCRGMRKELNGYRPDLTLACSALIMWAVSRQDAPRVLRDFAVAKFLQGAQGQEGSHTELRTEETRGDG